MRDDVDRVVGMAATVHDVTKRKKAEEKIHSLAYYDSLTGLANRHLFKDRVAQAIAYAQRHQVIVAILYMDLDRFKVINDTLGHGMGDHLLQEVAERLKTCVRTSDSVARHSELRWNHPKLGILSPGKFLQIVEDIGLGVQFGEWVLRAPCTLAKCWSATGPAPIRLAVNLPDSQFHDAHLTNTVANILKETTFPAKLLDLELTSRSFETSQPTSGTRR